MLRGGMLTIGSRGKLPSENIRGALRQFISACYSLLSAPARRRTMTGSQHATLPVSRPRDSAERISRYAEFLLIAASLLSAAVFITVGAGRPVWLDEANSIRIANQPFAGIIESLRHDN